MYTQFHFACQLKASTPQEVIAVLQYMADPKTEEKPETPNNDFFGCLRWSYLFTMGSAYFDYNTHCDFMRRSYLKHYELSVTSNLKNYDNEIQEFLKWIHPYVNKLNDEFMGYFRYEEDNRPTLIVYDKDGFNYEFLQS